jgi:uncharacterized protein
MATTTAERRRSATPPTSSAVDSLASSPPANAEKSAAPKALRPPLAPVPLLLDFFPLESEEQTRLARFFERLREGRLSTTRCPIDEILHWPPRVACPQCHSDRLEWIDLPEQGQIYAFSAVLAGAPLGMEEEVPFVVGLVDLEGIPLRIFGRIEGTTWQNCRIGQTVRVESYSRTDGRVFYRFRVLQ